LAIPIPIGYLFQKVLPIPIPILITNTETEIFGHFGPTFLGPKYPGSEVSDKPFVMYVRLQSSQASRVTTIVG